MGDVAASRIDWSLTTGAPNDAAVLLADGRLYCPSGDGSLYVVDAKSGTVRWTFDAGDWLHAPPALDQGVLYFASDRGDLHAVRASDGTSLWKVSTGVRLETSPVVGGGLVCVGESTGFAGQILAFSTLDGGWVWKKDLPGTLRGSLVLRGDALYFSEAASPSGVLHVLDLATGEERTRVNFDAALDTTPLLIDDCAIVADRQGRVHAVDLDDPGCAVRWSCLAGDKTYTKSLATRDGLVFYADRTGKLVAIEIATGTPRWEVQLHSSIYADPVVHEGLIYLGTMSGSIEARRVSDGSRRWNLPTSIGQRSTALIHDGNLYVGTTDARFLALPLR